MSADGIKALIMFLITNIITAVGSLQYPVSSPQFLASCSFQFLNPCRISCFFLIILFHVTVSKAENTIIMMCIMPVNLTVSATAQAHWCRKLLVSTNIFKLFPTMWMHSQIFYFFLWLGEWDVYWFCFAFSFVEICNAFYPTAPTVIFLTFSQLTHTFTSKGNHFEAAPDMHKTVNLYLYCSFFSFKLIFNLIYIFKYKLSGVGWVEFCFF